MQRWHFSALLGLTAALASLVAPELAARQADAPSPLPPPPPAPELVEVTPQPETTGKLHLTAGLDHPALVQGEVSERYLVITVGADMADGEARRPLNVALVMDRSGSMAEEGRMQAARDAASELVSSLGAEDRFAFVTFSDRAQLRIPSAPATNTPGLLRSVQNVYAGGGTNLYEGMRIGHREVLGHSGMSSVDHLILLSDGYANVGITRPSAFQEAARQWADSGVSVSTVGLGLAYNEDLLASMADNAGGSYYFASSGQDLTQIFANEFSRMNTVVAHGTRVTVQLDDAELIEVLGYEASSDKLGQFEVFLGDMHGGETRRIVARVRMRGETAGSQLHAARVILDEAAEVTYAPAEVQAVVSTDRYEVERTANHELATLGNEAHAGDLAKKAATAYAAGDSRRSQDLLDSSALILGQAASRYDFDSNRLIERQDQVQKQQEAYAAPAASPAGQEAVKMNKSEVRGWYH